MQRLNRKLPLVPTHQFGLVPRADVPRSTFSSTATYKTTFGSDKLIPVFLEEVLPGDQYKGSGQVFLRMATPLFPLMDNIHLDAFFFFVPNRLVWDNWVRFMGQQDDPTDSIDYTIPQYAPSVTYRGTGSLWDYFGLPVGPHVTANISVNALPFRAYMLIYNEWFRDENLQNSSGFSKGDGPDVDGTFGSPEYRGKRHDYFTSCLPWPQKGIDTPLPIGGAAVVKTSGSRLLTGAQAIMTIAKDTDGTIPAGPGIIGFQGASTGAMIYGGGTAPTGAAGWYPTNLYADLSTATGSTVNSMRIAVATQQLLERDARGGTRYTELLQNHFGVTPQDFRLQRPEYIGGGSLVMHTQAIPQTSGTANDPAEPAASPTPLGSLGASSVGNGAIRFNYAASEHGYIIGLVAARADLTYQQGVQKTWQRLTKYDYYWPAYAFLGEQAVTLDELYATGVPANDDTIFGYQERWSEYRYRNSYITGQFRSGIAGTMDAWHAAEYFSTPPALNATFIRSRTPMDRILAAGSLAADQEFLLDSVWQVSATRAMPARSVPGLTRF